MSGEVAGCGKRLVAPALATHVGPVSCVSAPVVDECTGLGERLSASVLVTDKGLVPCMGALVFGEIAGVVNVL
ncbi:hypothetical protein [Sansalvadorimonas verongulae]|uniref:hypothetical protein n=1 Tax=Sansalvadorimonas verongulae TaxID=2172824 RepID=UPI001E350C92|nr:hypothetical protein [Sansalvadorimonas verongulae]